MPSDLRDSQCPFGLSGLPDLALQKESPFFSSVAKAGVGFVRVFLTWPKANDALASQDRWIKQFSEHSIKILGVIEAHIGHGAETILTPENYTVLCRQMVQRYGDRISHWEICDQPDDKDYWLQDEMKSYSDFLMKASFGIREEDPSAKVHLGSLGKKLPHALSQIYDRGCGAFFDIVNIQPFINPLMPDAIGGLHYLYERVRQVMAKGGDLHKSVWFSRIACPGVQSAATIREWFLGKNPLEVHQAEWLRMVYNRALRWEGVEKIFWEGWQDEPANSKEGSDYFGLLRADGTAKPSFQSYASAALGWLNSQSLKTP